jgi:hypothetical protein
VILRGTGDPIIVVGAVAAVAAIFAFEALYLRHRNPDTEKPVGGN